MNHTFGRVAAHCGLRLSYYITAAAVGLSFLILVPTDYITATPLYILLVLATAPSLIKSMFFSGKTEEKRANDLAFPLFCKKYHYNFVAYKSMNLAYLLLFILFAAWRISYITQQAIPEVISFLPVLIAGVSLLTRLLAVIGYRLYFHLFPLKAMH